MPKLEETSSKSKQDYLKALLILAKNGNPITTSDIAKYFKISPPSVTEMLKKLAENGYINYSPYHGSNLTPKGLREAQIITRKHRLLERFLCDVLHVRKDQVHAQACEMEHALSDEAEDSLCRFLEHPDTCPDDGKIIPACDLPFSTCEECVKNKSNLEEVGRRQQNLVSICALKTGSRARISFIRGERRVLQRLLDMGLTPGVAIRMERIAPLKGPVEVSVRGSKIAIGQDIAAKIFVECS